MVLDCTEGSNCTCTHCPSCVLPWSLVHFFHSVVNTSKQNMLPGLHSSALVKRENLCHVKKNKKNLEIYKYMKKYVDRGGIMKQLNKRSVLFFKRVVSSTFFSAVGVRSENTVAQIKTLLSSEQFYYSPLVLLPQGKLFHKVVFTQECFWSSGACIS